MVALPPRVVVVALAVLAAVASAWVMLPDQKPERPHAAGDATSSTEPAAAPTPSEPVPVLVAGLSVGVDGTGQ